MKSPIVRTAFAIAFMLGALSLTGCRTFHSAGMTTALEPGQRLDIVAVGEDAIVELTNEGPGSVTLFSDAARSRSRAEIRLGVRGVTKLPAPAGGGGGTFWIVNRSTEKATICVNVTGAEGVNIKGPTVCTGVE